MFIWLIVGAAVVFTSLTVGAVATAKSSKKEDTIYDDNPDKNKDDVVEEEQVSEDIGDITKSRIRNAIISDEMLNNRSTLKKDKKKLSSDVVSFDNSDIKLSDELTKKDEIKNNDDAEDDDSLEEESKKEKEYQFATYKLVGCFNEEFTGKKCKKIINEDCDNAEVCNVKIKVNNEEITKTISFDNVKQIDGNFTVGIAELDKDFAMHVVENEEKFVYKFITNDENGILLATDFDDYSSSIPQVRRVILIKGGVIYRYSSEVRSNATGELYNSINDKDVDAHFLYNDEKLKFKEMTNGIPVDANIDLDENTKFTINYIKYDNEKKVYTVEGKYEYLDPDIYKANHEDDLVTDTGCFEFQNAFDIFDKNKINLKEGKRENRYLDDNHTISEAQVKDGKYDSSENCVIYNNDEKSDISYFQGIYNFLTNKANGTIYKYKSSNNSSSSDKEYKYFVGEFDTNFRLKKGKQYDEEENLIYDGEFKNGKRHGKVGKEYRNGRLIYEGGFANDEREGKGKVFDANGDVIYDGEFKNGKRHGKVGKEYKNGRLIYEGGFANDKREGKGKVFDANGDVIYDGEFKNGEYYNGKGKQYDKEENLIYDGEFKNGKRHGKECYVYENGSNVYYGEYNEGKKGPSFSMYIKKGIRFNNGKIDDYKILKIGSAKKIETADKNDKSIFELKNIELDRAGKVKKAEEIKFQSKDGKTKYIVKDVKLDRGKLIGKIYFNTIQVDEQKRKGDYNYYEGEIDIKNITDPDTITVFPKGNVELKREVQICTSYNKDDKDKCTYVKMKVLATGKYINNGTEFEGTVDYSSYSPGLKLKGIFDGNFNVISGNKYSLAQDSDIKVKIGGENYKVKFDNITLDVDFGSFPSESESIIAEKNNKTIIYSNVTVWLMKEEEKRYIANDSGKIKYNSFGKQNFYTGKIASSVPNGKGVMKLLSERGLLYFVGTFENGKPKKGKLTDENKKQITTDNCEFDENYEPKNLDSYVFVKSEFKYKLNDNDNQLGIADSNGNCITDFICIYDKKDTKEAIFVPAGEKNSIKVENDKFVFAEGADSVTVVKKNGNKLYVGECKRDFNTSDFSEDLKIKNGKEYNFLVTNNKYKATLTYEGTFNANEKYNKGKERKEDGGIVEYDNGSVVQPAQPVQPQQAQVNNAENNNNQQPIQEGNNNVQEGNNRGERVEEALVNNAEQQAQNAENNENNNNSAQEVPANENQEDNNREVNNNDQQQINNQEGNNNIGEHEGDGEENNENAEAQVNNEENNENLENNNNAEEREDDNENREDNSSKRSDESREDDNDTEESKEEEHEEEDEIKEIKQGEVWFQIGEHDVGNKISKAYYVTSGINVLGVWLKGERINNGTIKGTAKYVKKIRILNNSLLKDDIIFTLSGEFSEDDIKKLIQCNFKAKMYGKIYKNTTSFNVKFINNNSSLQTSDLKLSRESGGTLKYYCYYDISKRQLECNNGSIEYENVLLDDDKNTKITYYEGGIANGLPDGADGSMLYEQNGTKFKFIGSFEKGLPKKGTIYQETEVENQYQIIHNDVEVDEYYNVKQVQEQVDNGEGNAHIENEEKQAKIYDDDNEIEVNVNVTGDYNDDETKFTGVVDYSNYIPGLILRGTFDKNFNIITDEKYSLVKPIEISFEGKKIQMKLQQQKARNKELKSAFDAIAFFSVNNVIFRYDKLDGITYNNCILLNKEGKLEIEKGETTEKSIEYLNDCDNGVERYSYNGAIKSSVPNGKGKMLLRINYINNLYFVGTFENGKPKKGKLIDNAGVEITRECEFNENYEPKDLSNYVFVKSDFNYKLNKNKMLLNDREEYFKCIYNAVDEAIFVPAGEENNIKVEDNKFVFTAGVDSVTVVKKNGDKLYVGECKRDFNTSDFSEDLKIKNGKEYILSINNNEYITTLRYEGTFGEDEIYVTGTEYVEGREKKYLNGVVQINNDIDTNLNNSRSDIRIA